jgi:ubiquinone/menaquinone biosynthesis C-methylase UbiE
MEEYYYDSLLKAFLRGTHPESNTMIDEMSSEALGQFARNMEYPIYSFKRSIHLPRVRRAIGTLKGLYPDTVLDIGSGRGTFLWPLLDEMPDIDITTIDVNPQHIETCSAVTVGGYSHLKAQVMDATDLQFPDKSFHTVTMLEVLEHIPDYRKAVSEIIRVARTHIVLSVPSKPDDNPEHINFFTKESLSKLLLTFPKKNIHIEYVHNHMMLVVTK